MHRKVLQRFGLAKDPFTKDVPPDQLFGHPGSEVAVDRLVTALEGRVSAVLTGEPGTGKTFVFRAAEARLPQGRFRVTYIHNATLKLADFYRQISASLGIEPRATAEAVFRAVSTEIEEIALAQKMQTVIVIDEAHLLPIAVLGHLHILLNYHKDSKPLLSIVMIGLSELREKLSRNVFGSLAARLAVRIHIQPLDAEQVGNYLRHRLRIAGCSNEVFSEDAILLTTEATGGILRKIDVLASAALEVSVEAKNRVIDASVIQDAVKRCAEAIV